MIDIEKLEAKQEKIRKFVEDCDECERKITYSYLYNLGHRIEGIEPLILELAPRKQ